MTFRRSTSVSIVFIMLSVTVHAQTYPVGTVIAREHQEIELTLCGNDTGSIALVDLNGELNGGSYHVVWISFFTSW